MRIPPEVLLPNLYESDNKTLSEDKGAQPVDSSARLRATLSNSLSKQKHALEKPLSASSRGRTAKGNLLAAAINVVPKRQRERRQEQRRKEKLPVLLDTRVSRSRRKSVRDSAIDCKI
ncbi:MAG: hypothetical protein IPJ48_08375 [Propionivibrio sp.]|uniref:Uncharacterized protein n=1 Tax=Candidatus Propionivibrio dominans TaxID=2954373 RepID=A0A9D7F6U2_9RHOO|nr:hypothetical protein [Candidatus Propionivibrio dominans]